MPIRPPARIFHRLPTALAAIILACALALWAGRHAGEWLVAEDPLAKADAILVLAGTRMERPLEALDLYREGWAPLIVLTRDRRDAGERELQKRGLHVPMAADTVRDLYVRMGVPPGAILIAPGEHDSTADESRTLHALAAARSWHRVIVVTSKMHTRRAGYAMRRALKPLNVDVRLRASRYDLEATSRWWRSRSATRYVILEWQKFAVYVLGLD